MAAANDKFYVNRRGKPIAMSTGAGKLCHPYCGLFVLNDGWGWLTFGLQYTAAL
jgi:hypothetical protein